jgi:hypothetical protein
MAMRIFKPATEAQVRTRIEDALKEWARSFGHRKGVTRNLDGSFNVRGHLNLTKERVFDYLVHEGELVRKHVRFRKVVGRYTARPTEFFMLLPEKIVGDAHMCGNLNECIMRSNGSHEGRIAITLYGW